MPIFPIHLTGFTTWNREHSREAEFRAFILRSPQEFIFEVTYQRIDYWGALQRNSHGFFEGEFSAKDGHNTWGGRANCTLIESDGQYTLDGSWYEEGYTYAWHSDLEPK